MNTESKVNFILKTLNYLFPEPKLSLFYKNEFTFLIAVMLSAQCTDAAVNSVTKQLFELYDIPEKFLSLGEDRLKEMIRPCGLFNSKAKSIISASSDIIKIYNGAVPRTFRELESLRGVGHKTASVVISQCFGEPAFPVDTHISRLANRWQLSASKNVNIIERDMKSIFPEQTWKKLHIQLIMYGRKYCPAKNHSILNCPICGKLAANT